MVQLIHGDCYQEIKKIPDKSVDLVYIDIPYFFENGEGGGAFGTKNRPYREETKLSSNEKTEKLKAEAERLKNIMDNANNKDEYEAAHAQRGNVLKKINYMGIDKGIDITILDELVRVLKNIYIYMV